MSRVIPVKKNEHIDVVFEDLTNEGSGVAKVDGYPIFVPQALPGEKASIRIVKANKGFGYGRLIEVHESSPHRVEIDPEKANSYGGCQLQHMDYEGQLKYKQNKVEQVLQRIGKLGDDVVVHPIIGMENPWHYRNKAQVPVGEKDGKLIVGFYRPRSHDIVDMTDNVLQITEINEAVQEVKEICERFKIPAYNEETHKGVLRHIMVRYAKATGELMIVLITKTNRLPNGDQVVDAIVENLPQVKSVIQNVNSEKTNVILGGKTTVLWGNDVIYDAIGDVRFSISPLSFYQVNPDQTGVLYEKAMEYAALTGEETVIDAYSGIGTISLFLARKAKHVYGIEVTPEAVEDARKNVKLNKITNVSFTTGKVEDILPKLVDEGVEADVIVVDPPRKGCDEELLKTIIDMKVDRVVYVSCNPGTLARDLRILEDGGYKTIEVQPVDMFPQTIHVELVALMSRVGEWEELEY